MIPKSTIYSAPSGPKAQCEGRSNPSWGSLDAGPVMRLTAKSKTLPVFMSTRTTLKPEGTVALLRVVMGARSPKQATKASPSKPKSEDGEKLTPFAAAWVSKETNGLGGDGFGNSARTGSRP